MCYVFVRENDTRHRCQVDAGSVAAIWTEAKAAAVEAALEEYVRLRRKELLLGLPGRVRLEENWRELRGLELGESFSTD